MLFKDFNIKKYLNKQPPSDNSDQTKKEIIELTKIPIRENFVKEMDDGQKVFEKIVGKDSVIKKIINDSDTVIDKLKKHFNRPRPKVLAKKFNIKMDDLELDTIQAYLLGLYLSDKYPNKKNKLMKAARDISYSRRVARAHYLSDSMFGEKVGKDMYEYIKNKKI